MRTTIPALGLVLLAASAFAAPGTSTAPTPKPATRPAAAPPVAVPADVRARVVAQLPGAKPADVAASPIPGLYEVTMDGVIVYVSADGKYLVSGSLYDIASETNLTAERRNLARAKVLASMREDQMIIFSPERPTSTVTVFTDVDCGYCRQFHSHVAELNKLGVKVRYVPFPRTGPGTESWAKAESVWCAPDRKDALTRAKKGEPVKSKKCGDAVLKQGYQTGEDFGLEGTPAIYTQSGENIGGYLTPEQLIAIVQESDGPGGKAAR